MTREFDLCLENNVTGQRLSRGTRQFFMLSIS